MVRPSEAAYQERFSLSKLGSFRKVCRMISPTKPVPHCGGADLDVAVSTISFRSIDAREDRLGRESRAGAADAPDQLDHADRTRHSVPGEASEASKWKGAAGSSTARSDDADGGTERHLPRRRGLDRALCPGSLSVRADGLRRAARPRDDLRLRQDAWSRRDGEDQRGRAQDRNRVWTPRLNNCHERHDSAGSGDSLSKRDQPHGPLHAVDPKAGVASARQVRRGANEREEGRRKGEGTRPRGASLRQGWQSEEQGRQENPLDG